MINKLFELLNGIEYSRDIPEEAKEMAEKEGYIIILGGSDDLLLCYGAKSWMTEYEEHGYGWDGEDFKNIADKKLQDEANQLGLEIFWNGKNQSNKIKNYDWEKQGSFSYKVKDEVESKKFIVYEDIKTKEVYCTGLIVKLPNNFISKS
jgi:hypothetical protein